MKRHIQHLSEPLQAIGQSPYQFGTWLVVAVLLGLTGFWFPLFLLFARGQAVSPTMQELVNAGSLAVFSVVILANGIASSWSIVHAGSNRTSAGIRALFSVLALVIVVLQAGFLATRELTADTSVALQAAVTTLAVAIAVYLYCFQYPDLWEALVDEVPKKDNARVEQIAGKAQEAEKDSSGVRL